MKIVNGWKSLAICAKKILDVWQGSVYASVIPGQKSIDYLYKA